MTYLAWESCLVESGRLESSSFSSAADFLIILPLVIEASFSGSSYDMESCFCRAYELLSTTSTNLFMPWTSTNLSSLTFDSFRCNSEFSAITALHRLTASSCFA